jgi:hypothetical protein
MIFKEYFEANYVLRKKELFYLFFSFLIFHI